MVNVLPTRYLVPPHTVGPELLFVEHQPTKTKPVKVKLEFARTVTVDPEA